METLLLICILTIFSIFLVFMVMFIILRKYKIYVPDTKIKNKPTGSKQFLIKGKKYTWHELMKIPVDDKNELFNVPKGCASITTLDVDDWDVSNVSDMVPLKNMNLKQHKYCVDNNLIDILPHIGPYAFIKPDIKEMFYKLDYEN